MRLLVLWCHCFVCHAYGMTTNCHSLMSHLSICPCSEFVKSSFHFQTTQKFMGISAYCTRLQCFFHIVTIDWLMIDWYQKWSASIDVHCPWSSFNDTDAAHVPTFAQLTFWMIHRIHSSESKNTCSWRNLWRFELVQMSSPLSMVESQWHCLLTQLMCTCDLIPDHRSLYSTADATESGFKLHECVFE